MNDIRDVIIKQLTVHKDIPDREDDNLEPGFLMEVLRDDDDLLTRFGQTTFTVAYKDTIKETQVIQAGADDYKLILIPIGVAHGYKVVSEEPVLLFYHTTESYSLDFPDEERIPWDDSEIGFDWESV